MTAGAETGGKRVPAAVRLSATALGRSLESPDVWPHARTSFAPHGCRSGWSAEARSARRGSSLADINERHCLRVSLVSHRPHVRGRDVGLDFALVMAVAMRYGVYSQSVVASQGVIHFLRREYRLGRASPPSSAKSLRRFGLDLREVRLRSSLIER